MATSIVYQSILFIPPADVLDEQSILADTLIQSFAANSLGNYIVRGYKNLTHWNGTIYDAARTGLEISGFIAPSFVATVESNLPTLQSHFPTFIVVTYNSSTFG